jgi:hypothetical protein
MAHETVIFEGVDKVLSNLNREIEAIKFRSLGGLIVGSIIVRRDMEVTSPLVPVDLGNLRASWFTVTRLGAGSTTSAFVGEDASELAYKYIMSINDAKADADADSDPILIMGFSAGYALWVHELVDGTFKRPGAGAKFLESALKRNKNAILRAIADSAQIPK